MLIYILITVILLIILFVLYSLSQNIKSLQSKISDQFKETRIINTEIKELLTSQGKIISDIKNNTAFIEENTKEQKSHDKMNDIMLTKLKTDLAKIINIVEK